MSKCPYEVKRELRQDGHTALSCAKLWEAVNHHNVKINAKACDDCDQNGNGAFIREIKILWLRVQLQRPVRLRHATMDEVACKLVNLGAADAARRTLLDSVQMEDGLTLAEATRISHIIDTAEEQRGVRG